ncbi:hypothetical protein NOF04DRAFT_17965 [Fusarium oxysporum II5]|uniref:CENP-V/GFA domain-containing protein n=2 Tax=Fusarium oxysporum species complex TaxID=171631 RepID=X0J4S5_FUSO5|nr:uncharacterized protein FOIG_15480 [Fusarium odoratissimum NRRL 54006]EXL91326.1 hypothetical protein FOIG_15480 [Fusarium odoratissimum NRRL 54006]KAK2123257.1 hypothetical protein NOF04DRAFT_17965 [Fusarium oxysporum II5]TXB97057.1 hypothetical protein FocTR4_00011833 [Fusarium oxysporum f. sp. cubense]
MVSTGGCQCGAIRYSANVDPRTCPRLGDSGKLYHHNFCGNCGAEVFGVPEAAPEVLSIKVGSLDSRYKNIGPMDAEPFWKRKIKCSNENPCARCHRFGLPCRYSPTRPIGRPSKRRGTSPNQCSSAAACPNEGPLFESLDIPEDFDSAMTLDTLGAPMTFPTPPDEFSWSEWSALDAMMSAAYPPNATSQNQHVQAHGEKSQVVDGVNNPDSNTQCQCGDMVREHMNNRTSTHDLPRIVARQRKSAELAQKILDCNNCGGINNAPSQIAGNVLLFGAVMTEATSSCQSFIRDLEQRAFVPDDEQSNTQICLALMDPNDHHIEYKLDRQYVWPLAKVLLGIETDKLSRICIAFITRQWRVHERGHEGCQAGATCRKLKTTQTSCPADFCPRSIEPASFFSCFRTARHLQSLISTLQKDLE